MKHNPLAVSLLLILACLGWEHTRSAENVELPKFLDDLRNRGDREATTLYFNYWQGQWIRFKGQVWTKHSFPTDGIYLHTPNTDDKVWIRETDPASKRHDRYEEDEVYTFRVRIIDITKPLYGRNILLETTLSDD